MSKGKIDLRLHESYKDNPTVIDDIDFGDLMLRLGHHHYSRQFTVTFERTQEIELIFAVVGIIGGAYFKTLGSELAKWTIEELKRRVELRRAEIKAGRKTVLVGRRGWKKAVDEIERLLKSAHKSGQTVEVMMIRRS